MGRGLFLFILILCLSVMLLGNSKSEAAYRTYQEALNAYNAGEFERAIKLFEYVLQTYPKIESEVPEIKLYLGVSAFYVREYGKAKAYLQLFPESPLAQELLKKINEIEKVETSGQIDWGGYREVQPSATNPQQSLQTEEATASSSNRILLVVMISSFVAIGGFLALTFIFIKLGLMNVGTVKKELSVAPDKEKLEETTYEGPDLHELKDQTAEAEEIEEIEVERLIQEELEDVRTLLEGITETEETAEAETEIAQDQESTNESEEEEEITVEELSYESQSDVFSTALEILEKRLSELEESPSSANDGFKPIDEIEAERPFPELLEELEEKEELEEEDIEILIKAAAKRTKERLDKDDES
ncbi:MAG: hypothetical protein PWP37_790 [Thermotogota bacterium]|nr:hypothetical protein [Thermotogota bacterium]MDK2864598.1 hypothetical protein [Thermotogota bacterium]HCZ05618.1 hypothetical protein [Thermotogota bacterium]